MSRLENDCIKTKQNTKKHNTKQKNPAMTTAITVNGVWRRDAGGPRQRLDSRIFVISWQQKHS